MGNTKTMQEDRSNIDNQGKIFKKTAVLGQTERRSTEDTANILIIDVSSSTNDKIAEHDPRPKITGIKDANTTFIVDLPDSAYISVISVGFEAEILCDMQIVGQNRLPIIKKVQGLIPSGPTPMCGALNRASELCRKVPSGKTIRVFILTDGLSTDGAPLPIAERLKQSYPNLQLHVIGFGCGDQIDEGLLRKMASCSASGSPFYYHILDAVNLTGVLKRHSRTLYK